MYGFFRRRSQAGNWISGEVFFKDSKKCKKLAVVEAVFVASCKLNLLCESWHIEFDWIRSLEGTDEFINVLSSKGNVENRLTKAYRLVKEKYNV